MFTLKQSIITLANLFGIGIALFACAPRATILLQDASPLHMPPYAEGCIGNPDMRSSACREGFRRAGIEGDPTTAGQLLLLSQGNTASTPTLALALWLNQTPWVPQTFPALKAAIDDVFVPRPENAQGAVVAFDVSVDEEMLPSHCPVIMLPLDPPGDTAAIETAAFSAAAAGAVAITWELDSQLVAAPALPLLSSTLGGVVPTATGVRWAIFAGRADHALRLGELREAHSSLKTAISELSEQTSRCQTTATFYYWTWWLGLMVGDNHHPDIRNTIDQLCNQPSSSEEDRRWGETLQLFVNMEIAFRNDAGLRDPTIVAAARRAAAGSPTRLAALLSAMANALQFESRAIETTSAPTPKPLSADDIAAQLTAAGRPDWGAILAARSKRWGVLDRFGRTDRKRIEKFVERLGTRSHRWHAGATAADTLAYLTARADVDHDPNATVPLCAILTDTIRSLVDATPKPSPKQRAWWAFRLAAAAPVCPDDKPIRETVEVLAPAHDPDVLALTLSQVFLWSVAKPEIAEAALQSIGTWARVRAQTLDPAPQSKLTKLKMSIIATVSAWFAGDPNRFFPSLTETTAIATSVMTDAESTPSSGTRHHALTLRVLSAFLNVAGALRFGSPEEKTTALVEFDGILSAHLPELLDYFVPEAHRGTIGRLIRLTRSLLTTASGKIPPAGDQLDWTVLADSFAAPPQTDAWTKTIAAVQPLLWASIALAQQRVGDLDGAASSRQKAVSLLYNENPDPTGALSTNEQHPSQSWEYEPIILPIVLFTLSHLDNTPSAFLIAEQHLRARKDMSSSLPVATGVTEVTNGGGGHLQTLLDLVRSKATDPQLLDHIRIMTADMDKESIWDALLFVRANLEQRLGYSADAAASLERYLTFVSSGSPGETLVVCDGEAHVGQIGTHVRTQFRLGLLLGATTHKPTATTEWFGAGVHFSNTTDSFVHCDLQRPPTMAIDLVLEAASAYAILSMMNNNYSATDTSLALATQAAHLLTDGNPPVLSDTQSTWLQLCRDAIATPGHDSMTAAAWATALGRLRGHGLLSQELDSRVWEFARTRRVPVSSTFVHGSPVPRLLPQNHPDLLRIRPLAIAWSLAQQPADTGTLVAASKALAFRTVLLPPWGAQLAGDVLRAALGDVPTSVVNSPMVREDKDPTGHAVTTMWRYLMKATGTTKVSVTTAEEIVRDLLKQGYTTEACLFVSRLSEIAFAAGQTDLGPELIRLVDGKPTSETTKQPDWLRGRLLDITGRSLAVSGNLNDAALILEAANRTLAGLLPNRDYYEKLLTAINIRGAAQRYSTDLERDTEQLATYLGQTFEYNDPMVFRLQTASLALKIVLDRPWSELASILHNRAVIEESDPITQGKRFVNKVRSLDQPAQRHKLAATYLTYLFQNGPAPQ
ncbi:MAG: hypothetical protein HUU55_02010 [Myxococcales bacterium]|nr:hypothetical protein [Myxococcales bacterium]